MLLFAGASPENNTNESFSDNSSEFIDVDDYLNITENQTNETSEEQTEFVNIDELTAKYNESEGEYENDSEEFIDIDDLINTSDEIEENVTGENDTAEIIGVEEYINNTVNETQENLPIQQLALTRENKQKKKGILLDNIKDAGGKKIDAEIIFTSKKDSKIYKKSFKEKSLDIPKGKYKVKIKPENHPIKEIKIDELEIDENIESIVDLDEPDEKKIAGPDGIKFTEVYVINPKQDISGTFIVQAKGSKVYKCAEWDFENRICKGEWKHILDVTPGEYYTIDFDSADPAYGEGSSYFTLTTITIDGDFEDWAGVLSNSHNTMWDGIKGIDDLDTQQTFDRDLKLYAFTWDNDYYYSYIERTAGGNTQFSFLLYLDIDNNLKLDGSDKLVKYIWHNNGEWDSYLYNYSPANVSGDNITGDGTPEPGTFLAGSEISLESNMYGTGANGIHMEFRINWSHLGITPGSPINLHASTARGSATNLPSQIEDNMNAVYTEIIEVDIDPDREGSGCNGDTVRYNHTVTNLGNLNDTINIVTSGTTLGFTVNLTFANGTPLTDTNNDSKVDVGELTPGQSKNITIAITITGVSCGDIDQTYIIASSSLNSSRTDSILDTTTMGPVVIYPSRTGKSVNGSTIIYNHTVVSNLPGNNTIDINATSNNSYTVNVTYLNGTYLTDTDGDGTIDVGNVSQGTETIILVRIQIPGSALIGSQDITTVTAFKSGNSSMNSSVTDTTTVSEPLTIVPNRTGYIPVYGCRFYQHTVTNSQNDTDVADITFSSSEGWIWKFYENDKTTPLTDTDGDGYNDTGNISAFGGTKSIQAYVCTPAAVPENTTDLTNITVNSSLTAGVFDYVTDNSTARTLITYNNSGRTQPSELFSKTQTVYARSYSLSGYNKVYYRWINSNGTLVRQTPAINVEDDDTADDRLILNLSSLSGRYTIYLHNNQGGAEIVHEFFYVSGVPNVTIVVPNGGENWSGTRIIYYNVSDDSAENVTVTIQYSSNNGSSWNNIATGIQLNGTFNCTYNGDQRWCVQGQYNYSWDTTTVSDGINYLIRVIVDNTYFEGDDDSDEVFTIDNSGPTVSLNYPPQGYVNVTSPLNITFNCSATNGVGLRNISLYITDSSNQSFSLNQTTNISGTSNESTWTLELEEGTYTWNCLAYDIAGNPDWGNQNRTITIGGIKYCIYANSPNQIYTLGANLEGNKSDTACITVNAENVTIDCSGFSIIGNQSGSTSAIMVNGYTNVTIQNCVVNNYSRGFYLNGSNYSTLRNNTAYDNIHGFSLDSSSENRLENNSAYNNTYGVFIDPSYNNTIIENNVYNNSLYGLYLEDSHNNTLRNNTVYNNTDGFYLNYSSNNTLLYNNVSNNSRYGIAYYYSNYTKIINNTVNGNGGDGITGTNSDNVNISYNEINYGGDDAIFNYISTDAWIEGNAINYAAKDGIDIPNNTGTYVLDNNITDPGQIGIRCDNCYNVLINNTNISLASAAIGSAVLGNTTISYNTLSDSTHGIYFVANTFDNNITDNIIYDNTNGIYLERGGDNRISRNTIHNSQRGAYIYNSSGNEFYNTTFYNNDYDVYVRNTQLTPFILNMSNTTFRNPTGTLENYTVLSINDSIDASSAYSINWTTNSSALPADYISFAQKFVNITTHVGAVSMDSVVWHWYDSELAGYFENRFELWKYNSSGWNDTNALLNTSTNTLSLTNFNPASDYGILQSDEELCYVSGEVTDAFGSTVPSNVQMYDINWSIVGNTTQDYNISVICNRTYYFVIIPDSGNFISLVMNNLTVNTSITEVVDLEDAPETMMGPGSFINWTEAIAWSPNMTLNFTSITINMTYSGNNLGFYKCSNWNYTTRNCTDDNWTFFDDVPDGNNNYTRTFSKGDPGGGIGSKPNVTAYMKVYDVTGLNATGRKNNGTLIGTFTNGTQVNFTYGNAYRIEIFLSNNISNTNGIIRDPYHDNIPEELAMDMTGFDSPNVTIVAGIVTVNSFNATNTAGTEVGTRKLIWDADPSHKLIENLSVGDLVKLWYIVDYNATNSSLNNATFYGNVQGTNNDVELINPFNTEGAISSCFYANNPNQTYTLGANLTGNKSDAACITVNATNVTINCAGFSITGDEPSTIGIFVNGFTYITIINCVVANYTNGFYLNSSNDSSFINNTAHNNTYGFYIDSSSNNNMTNNTIENNTDGVFFDSLSGSNILLSNRMCFNSFDVNNTNTSNSGNLDRCTSFSGWTESGHSGCTFTCSLVWNEFYGNLSGMLKLAPNTADMFYTWVWDGQRGKVYVINGDANISWINLTALGRMVNGSPSSNDFEKLDTVLGYNTTTGNVNETFSTDGSTPKETQNISIFERMVDYVPVANSSTYLSFKTGIVWDASQSTNGTFDENEDVVFLTEINGSQPEDYQIIVPGTFDTYKGGSGVVEFWAELD